MISRPNRVCVLDTPPAVAGSSDEIRMNGRRLETGQGHLIEPFARLLAAVDALVDRAAHQGAMPEERACLETAFCALFRFFHALLPSACTETLSELTRAVTLLLVREAMEAAKAVADSPASEESSAPTAQPAEDSRSLSPERLDS